MHRVIETISKMFVVLVLLFGSPPPVSLRQRSWSPVVTLVSTVNRRGDGDPLGLTDVAPSDPPSTLWGGQRALVPKRESRVFHPVQAA